MISNPVPICSLSKPFISYHHYNTACGIQRGMQWMPESDPHTISSLVMNISCWTLIWSNAASRSGLVFLWSDEIVTFMPLGLDPWSVTRPLSIPNDWSSTSTTGVFRWPFRFKLRRLLEATLLIDGRRIMRGRSVGREADITPQLVSTELQTVAPFVAPCYEENYQHEFWQTWYSQKQIDRSR